MTGWALSAVGFGVALGAALAGTPLARRAALRRGILDRPRAGKSHVRPTPYLGGLAILVGVAAGALASGAWRELAGLALGAALLAFVGLADDVRTVSVRLRLTVQTVAALAAVATGLRASPFGVSWLDLGLTVLWIVGITNAFNLLDNMDGLSAAAAAIAAASIFSVAAVQGQYLVAALAAAVAGGAAGFLPYNFPRARIFMGDAGSLLLGFLVAVIALKVQFPVARPLSFLATACVLGLPILDTTVVVVDRLRWGRPVAAGGTDHLSHRLVALGLSRVRAVTVLLGASACFGGLGVLAGLGAAPIALPVAAAAALCLVGSLLRVPPPAGASTVPLARRGALSHALARR